MLTDSEIYENKILLLLKNSDKSAFEYIYNKYSKKIAVKLLQLLKSEELVKDVLQDVFLKIWENREMINPDLSFNAYIFKIARNLSLNSFRRALLDQSYLSKLETDEEYNPIEEALYKKEYNAILQDALNVLTPRQREIFVLHKIEGKSYKEISDHLKISSSAINHHLQSANKHLRVVLKPYLIFIAFSFLC